MPSYHRLHSRYARLTSATIDSVLQAVRDANEVLCETDELSARDMLVIARSVLETERAYERDPQAFTEPDAHSSNDWTYACMADGFALAMEQLHARGALQAAERARTQGALVLRRIVDSATRSPLIDHSAVLAAAIDALPLAHARQRLALQRRYLAEELRFHRARNARSGLLQIGVTHLTLGQHALAFDIFTQLLQLDPTAFAAHAQLAEALQPSFPELAVAAAQRALLLATRDTPEPQRAALRSVLEHTRGLPPSAAGVSHPAQHCALLRLLRDKPGKRSRLTVQVLCESLVPELAYVQVKPSEPLPDAAALAQLRRDLHDLPFDTAPRAHKATA